MGQSHHLHTLHCMVLFVQLTSVSFTRAIFEYEGEQTYFLKRRLPNVWLFFQPGIDSFAIYHFEINSLLPAHMFVSKALVGIYMGIVR